MGGYQEKKLMNDASIQSQTDEAATSEVAARDSTQRPRGGRFAALLATLALLLAIALAAAGAYGYRYLIQPLQGVRAELLGVQALSDQAFQASIEDFKQRLDSLGSELAQANAQIVDAESRFTGYESRLDQLRGQAHWTQREWVLAEIVHLLQVGEARLRFMRDAGTAQNAARSALTRLDQIADPALMPLRQQLQRDIRILSQYRKPDPATLLGPVEAQIRTLKPLPGAAARSVSEAPPSPEPVSESDAVDEASTWYERVSAMVTSRVRVIHHDSALNALAHDTVDQQAYQLLQLRLESLRLTLLADDAAGFQRELEAMIQWVGGLLEARTAQPILEVLRGLRESDPFPPLPSLQGTIAQLEEVLGPASSTEGGESGANIDPAGGDAR